MGERTNIEWADDTWNPWHGCAKVSPGCSRCYAETLVMNRMGGGPYRKGIPRVRHAEATFNAPLKWNKKPWVCDVCGKANAPFLVEPAQCECGVVAMMHRRRVFSLSLGDWLDEEVPIEWLADMLEIVRRCPDLDFLLLTKRPENFFPRVIQACTLTIGGELERWYEQWERNTPPPNVWIGASVEDQQRADERIPELLKIPAAVRFLSAEPLLGPIDLKLRVQDFKPGAFARIEGIHWVIFGGESGPGARPCNIEWIQDGLRQCQAAGVAAFAKQLGSEPRSDNANQFDWPVGVELIASGKGFASCKPRFADKKGGDWEQWPDDLKVRQWPKQTLASDRSQR